MIKASLLGQVGLIANVKLHFFISSSDIKSTLGQVQSCTIYLSKIIVSLQSFGCNMCYLLITIGVLRFLLSENRDLL